MLLDSEHHVEKADRPTADASLPSNTDESVWTVIDLFSGAGGASFGFHAHPKFRVIAAADAQMGKPSSGPGKLGCNSTYELNMGFAPVEVDLSIIEPEELAQKMGLTSSPTVMIACPPCTGFSRTLAKNHIEDDPRNSLVVRTARYVQHIKPDIVVMENARELLMGRFSIHFERLNIELKSLGYSVHHDTHFLSKFGLPQKRERAIVIAVKEGLPLRTLDELWDGYTIVEQATHVRRAISDLKSLEAGEADPDDAAHVAPKFASSSTLDRLRAIPHDGGGWADLVGHALAETLMTPTMKARAEAKDFGSHPDVYGRMWWDRPAATIKRECSHVGNGRYSHPEQDRLCSVRELAILNGFPRDFQFGGTSLSNMYRHIGDAVPPLISYQLAQLCSWILTGERPRVEDLVLPSTHLDPSDIVSDDNA